MSGSNTKFFKNYFPGRVKFSKAWFIEAPNNLVKAGLDKGSKIVTGEVGANACFVLLGLVLANWIGGEALTRKIRVVIGSPDVNRSSHVKNTIKLP